MKPKGNHWFIVFDKKMEELYNYVRFGDRKKRLYDYKVELRTPVALQGFLVQIHWIGADGYFFILSHFSHIFPL